jgi:ABC-2 type transport system permease protein
MVVSIDQQFSRNLDAGKPANIQLILDGRRSNTAQIVAGYTTVIVDQYNSDFTTQANIQQQNAKLFSRFWYNPNLLYYWYNVPCLSGVLSMMVGLIVTALSVARERELGTFDQLLVSPVTPPEILIGKTVPALIIGLIEGSVIIMVGIFLFGIPFTGSLFNLYLGLFVFITSVVGVGLFISALCMTQQQAILGTFLFMTPAVTLSGFATPIENMPVWLQKLTYINPLRYYLVIAKGEFLKDMPFEMVLNNIWPMAISAVVNLICAAMFFRRRVL